MARAAAETRRGQVAGGVLGGWILTAACALCFLAELHARVPQVDDAYISYRYAAQLVEGHGLVFNVGERVEGYTNLLWTLAVAAGLVLGWPAPAVGHALGLASGLAALLASYALARAGGARGVWAGLAPWLVYASTSFARWATAGLETPLFAAAGAAALAAQARDRIGWATGFAVAATLTRPEGALLAAVVLGSHLLRHAGAGGRAWRAPALYAGFLLGLCAWRLAYYGDPLPNTFYAKVGGVPPLFGVGYAGSFLRDGAAWLLPPGLLAAWRVERLRPTALYAAAFMAYVVGVGGDSLGHARLLVPVLPCLAALAVAGAESAASLGRIAAAACVAAALVVQPLGWPTPGALAKPKRAAELARARGSDHLFESLARRRARVLRRRGEPPSLVATGAIGAFGYYARVPVLDLLGLVDPEVARSRPDPGGPGVPLPGHQRANPDYVLSRRPDYILVARKDSPGKGNLPAVAGLWAHPDLERLYVWDAALEGYRLRGGGRWPREPGATPR
jgi:arabinofuranosyltransferase